MEKKVDKKVSKEMASLLESLDEKELLEYINRGKQEAIKEKYKSTARRPLCIRMSLPLYEQVCRFCNCEDEFADRKVKSSVSGMIETVLNIFFVEKNLFDIYDKTYNRNNPKRAEGRDVGVPRKHKDKED